MTKRLTERDMYNCKEELRTEYDKLPDCRCEEYRKTLKELIKPYIGTTAQYSKHVLRVVKKVLKED